MTMIGQDVTPREPEEESWGELGPCMKSLNSRQRLFVRYLVTGKPGHGSVTQAARRAGYGRSDSKPSSLGKQAHDLSHHPKIIAAINEEAKRVIRGIGHAEAVAALFQVIRDVDHKDRVRAISAILDRCDPVETKHSIDVTHRIIDPIEEELEELGAARALGADRAMLIKLFGGNRLPYLERLDLERRADKAKTIDAEVDRSVPAGTDRRDSTQEIPDGR